MFISHLLRQVLDLSANSLSIDSILRIGFLAGLRELHLSGNDLHSLPEEMARPLISVDCFGLVTSQRERFPLLEKLWLDHNVFEDVRVFAILAGLKKLAYLNLSHNNIYSLPHLHFLPKEVIQRIEEEGGGVEGVISGISAMNVSLNPQNTPAPNAAGTVGTSSEAKRGRFIGYQVNYESGYQECAEKYLNFNHSFQLLLEDYTAVECSVVYNF